MLGYVQLTQIACRQFVSFSVLLKLFSPYSLCAAVVLHGRK